MKWISHVYWWPPVPWQSMMLIRTNLCPMFEASQWNPNDTPVEKRWPRKQFLADGNLCLWIFLHCMLRLNWLCFWFLTALETITIHFCFFNSMITPFLTPFYHWVSSSSLGVKKKGRILFWKQSLNINGWFLRWSRGLLSRSVHRKGWHLWQWVARWGGRYRTLWVGIVAERRHWD